MSKTTILIEKQTRDELRKRGIKGQTYDQVISDLLKSKDSLDKSIRTVSRESSRRPY
jgi:hypothetical protein